MYWQHEQVAQSNEQWRAWRDAHGTVWPNRAGHRCRTKVEQGSGNSDGNMIPDLPSGSGFRSQRPKPYNLSTMVPLVINRVTIRLTSL
jgi:hypothetical protein